MNSVTPTDMTTLRECRNDAGFDWERGVIIYHDVGPDRDAPGWANAVTREKIDSTHPILDERFITGYGAPEMPRFFARDEARIYHPAQHDGSTWVVVTDIDPECYLGEDSQTPYPGG